MTEESLMEILRKHKLWLADAPGGERADLSGRTLIGVNLYGADLREANLSRADLTGADLRHANMYGANMNNTELCAAKLFGSILGNWSRIEHLSDHQWDREWGEEENPFA